MINKDRLWNHLMTLGKIGASEDSKEGITRLAYTKEDVEAKVLVKKYMEEAGLNVHEDGVGNLIGKREGQNPELPGIMIGSHIDTVFQGGKFDGALGVLAGVEVAHALKEEGYSLKRKLEVVAFADEEGARFSTGMLGSQAMAGKVKEEMLDKKDKDGISLGEALKEKGFDPNKIQEVKREKGSIAAYLELHIEQAVQLERKEKSVGIVTGIAGPRWFKITVKGESGHAGSTPMSMRRDPMSASVRLIQSIEEIVSAKENTVGTVGKIEVKPGGINIIPSEVTFTLDLRDSRESERQTAEEEIRKTAKDLEVKQGVTIVFEQLHNLDPILCDEKIVTIAEESAKETGVEYLKMISGAAHDTINIAEFAPVGMLFIPSFNGLSHRPDEWSEKKDCGNGAKVLYQTVKILDGKL